MNPRAPLCAIVVAGLALTAASAAHALMAGGWAKRHPVPLSALPLPPANASSPQCAQAAQNALTEAVHADKAAIEAQQIVDALSTRSTLRKLLDDYTATLAQPLTDALAAADELLQKAPEALEPLGGFKGKPAALFKKGVAAYKAALGAMKKIFDRLAQARAKHLDPKDPAGLSHLISLVGRTATVAKELETNPEKVLDLDMAPSGLSEEFTNVFNSMKSKLGDLYREGKKLLTAMATVLPAPSVAKLKDKGYARFDKVGEDGKQGLVDIITAIANLSSMQAGEGGEDSESGEKPAAAEGDDAPKPAAEGEPSEAQPGEGGEAAQAEETPKPRRARKVKRRPPPPADENEPGQESSGPPDTSGPAPSEGDERKPPAEEAPPPSNE